MAGQKIDQSFPLHGVSLKGGRQRYGLPALRAAAVLRLTPVGIINILNAGEFFAESTQGMGYPVYFRAYMKLPSVPVPVRVGP